MNTVIDFFLVVVVGLVALPFLIGQNDASVWLSALALYISWLAAYYSTLRKYLSKPSFIVETNISRSPEGVPVNDISWFYRLKIRVNSETKVERCQVRLLQVLNMRDEDEGFDPLNFFWARQDDRNVESTPITLLGKDDYEYLDVAQFMNVSRKLRLRISTQKQLLARAGGSDFVETTTLAIKVGIFGDGAKTKILWVHLNWKERENYTESPYAME